MLKKTLEFLKRNSIWFIIGFIGLYFIAFEKEFLEMLYMISVVECLAIAFSGIAVFCYTKLDFINKKKSNDRFVLGWIILSVHLLIGFCVFGIYIARFSN